jgi:hypothetical protein
MSVIRMEDHEVAKRGNWKVWTKRINDAWQKSAEAIIETGRLLVNAKEGPDSLPHGEFTNMVQLKLNFGQSTASRLMLIAKNTQLSNHAHVHTLPPSWGTLYELTKLPEPLLLEKIKDGTITPKTERKEIMELLAVSDDGKAKTKKSAAKPKSKPETGPSTKDAFVDELKQLSKAQQVDEIFSVMGQLGLTFIDFGVSTLNLRKGK